MKRVFFGDSHVHLLEAAQTIWYKPISDVAEVLRECLDSLSYRLPLVQHFETDSSISSSFRQCHYVVSPLQYSSGLMASLKALFFPIRSQRMWNYAFTIIFLWLLWNQPLLSDFEIALLMLLYLEICEN